MPEVPADPLPFAAALPVHAAIVEALAREVAAADHWRWLELSCSLASGRGDELSDIDVGIGHTLEADEIDGRGSVLVEAVGDVVDYLVHSSPGWPPSTRRFAVEYAAGVQLDLVVIPAERREGLPDGALAIVDKDGALARPWTPPVAGPPSVDEACEWTMLAWWALSDTAKYLKRQSLFEAAERLAEARQHALRLTAVAGGIPFPSFGLVSLLDYEPFALPDGLDRTYCPPTSASTVFDAAVATAELLERASTDAGVVLGADLETPWSRLARRRLSAVAEHR